MVTVDRYEVDIFAIIVLVISILLIIFLIVATIYFANLINLKPPSQEESTFLFWVSVILAIIFIGIAIYAIIRIFTYRTVTISQPTTIPAITTTYPIATSPVTTTSVPMTTPSYTLVSS